MFGQSQSPPTPPELKAQLTTAMLDMAGCLEPIYDAADGMRRDLEARGWSPTMAETCAGTWLASTLAAVAGGGK
ncbi:hypothetical protein NPS70_16385 [Streptomyces sp. C10-9-1]|uniref:hypothetical protein n=1 Tax=Streptomyces sp. C10-9-1 TaxID=1859285 RepID=UPI002111C273|nr:hypothetical protein [Streptomyces sp. C10-9-1]MCQ6554764.1 hypothetical protein [Streptomyces sp. C10-9-1]